MAAQELVATIKAARASLKLLSKDINQIYSMGKLVIDESDESKLTIFQAMFSRLEQLLNNYMTTFTNTQCAAITGGGDELFPTQDDTKSRTEVSSLYYHVVKYHQELERRKNEPQTTGTTYPSANQSILSSTRLPNIILPRFSGRIADWPKFKQLYLCMVHNIPEIPVIEKYQHLISSLSDEAYLVVSSFTMSEDNYFQAWEAVLAAYDNKRLLASTYIDNILSFVPEKGQSTLSRLQSFIRVVSENIASFKSIKVPNETDFLLLCLALRNMDPDTRQGFETSCVRDEWPSYDALVTFIQNKIKVLKLTHPVVSPPKATSYPSKTIQKPRPQVLTTLHNPVENASVNVAKRTSICCCRHGHLLYTCPKFKELSLDERFNFLKGKNLCFNCFNQGHRSNLCKSVKRCQTCGGKHHTLLHSSSFNLNSTPKPAPLQVALPSTADPLCEPSKKPAVVASVLASSNVLLGTAEVFIRDATGQPQTIRLVIDCGSQSSLITVACARRLGLPWSPSPRSLQGAGQTPLPKVKGVLSCDLWSKVHTDSFLRAHPLVVTTITGHLPTSSITPSHVRQFLDQSLADPQFWSTRPIDFLLGNDLFMNILDINIPPVVIGSYGTLPTIFGQVIMGQLPSSDGPPSAACLSIMDSPLSDAMMRKFWETEEINTSDLEHPADRECEDLYVNSHFRRESGRYVVALPFKSSTTPLGDSKTSALSRFSHLENKLRRYATLRMQYTEFLQEYLNLDHMSLAVQPSRYIIPHHAVFKHNDPNGKLRVVFDASMTTTTGSLNSKLHAGPKLQNDLASIILHFRKHLIGITADLVKMYRQIEVIPEHRAFQHILWRSSVEEPLRTYELNTLTYGMTSSPYLALRTLLQLTRDEGYAYPIAAEVINNDVYVDDIVTGTNSLEAALQLKSQLLSLLGKGCFPIHKWASNSSSFMETVGPVCDDSVVPLDPSSATYTKILGMTWDPQQDVFRYQVHTVQGGVTKRSMLSTIARLFDPMGYLAPVIFHAKYLVQQVWRLPSVGWDDALPTPLQHAWQEFVDQLPLLSNITIPRHATFVSAEPLQLLGFCDASLKGYAAAFYLRSISNSGHIKVCLLIAKTKLAPLKTLSIPRLELSAAHLLVKLLNFMKSFISSLNIHSVSLFSDSTIVLSWLRIAPIDLQTFVANRVSFIVTHSALSQWHHIASDNNPADIASRGILPSLLQEHHLWWNSAPMFHTNSPYEQIQDHPVVVDLPEVKRHVLLTHSSSNVDFLGWVTSFSSYSRLIHSLGYVLRFISKIRLRINTPKFKHISGPLEPLSLPEIDAARLFIIKLIQQDAYSPEFSWENNQPTSKRLLILGVYKDSVGLLRVGGRLANAPIPYDSKHPILLPPTSHFTKLLIDYAHQAHFHLGSKALQAHIQRQFWIFRLRQLVKARVHNCLRCRKLAVKPYVPVMGDLPSSRVTSNRPFSSVGVDYAGPFQIKISSLRNASTNKAYLAVFVCMVTKAVHLEVVSSLSTETFLATLDRFVSRRGLPANIYSDCGTTFVGANRQLKELYAWFATSEVRSGIVNHTTSKHIHWHFNPPYSPHVGGLWEAAVKSAKLHLHKVLGAHTLTFEELTTLFVRIEAILNSRPLCPLSSDPSSYDYLTPGHFLIGASLVAAPEHDTTDLPVNRLSRWQFVQNATRHFWKRWHAEYLTTLQSKLKWYTKTKPIQVGDLVLMYDSASSPLFWRLARVVECHPGRDQVVRVVSIQTPDRRISRRSIHQLAPLFPPSSEDSE